MWKWIVGLVLALVVGFVFGKVTSMHHEKYGHKPSCHNKFSERYNDRGICPQCMRGPFNNGPMGPMMGKCPNGQPMDMRMPSPPPVNNMPGNGGCCNRLGNNDSKSGCRCGPNREGGNKMERRHEDDWDDDEDLFDDEDND